MKIGLRYGHSLNCKGAIKILDEVNECRSLYFRVKELLEGLGHTVVNCCSDAYSESAELAEGTSKANANEVDLYVTLHMNAYNGEANGVECWVYDAASTTAINAGRKVCSNINSLGIYNRGIKYGGNRYHDLSASTMDAIIVETIFCDSITDVNIFNSMKEQFARAIANGIDSRILLCDKPIAPPKPQVEQHRNLIVYQDGAAADRSSAEFFTMILNNAGEDCIPIDYTSYKSGKYFAWSIFAVGGALEGKLNYHKIFNGKDRNETAAEMLKHLKRY